MTTQLSATAAREPGSAAIELQLERILALIEANPAEHPAVAVHLLDLIDDVDGGARLRLARPGVVELLEFLMHRLRWFSVLERLLVIASGPYDMREVASARRVIESYAMDWPTGDIYDAYRSPRSRE